MNVQDLLSKKAVVVKVTPESQLHKLPPEFAQRIAMRLKGSMPPGTPGAGAERTSRRSSAESGPPETMKPGSETPAHASAGNGGAMPGGMRAGGGDFQQILSRMPTLSLADLHKGDALLIVATEGSTTAGATAITCSAAWNRFLRPRPAAKP